MSTVSDQARLLRQALAEQNISGRMNRATDMLNAISSIGAPSVPGTSSNVSPPVSQEEVARRMAEGAKREMVPCPTGYVRNGRGECVILISASAGLPLPTELMAAGLEQNIPALGYEQVYRGTSALPGVQYSTELINGMRGLGALGFDLEDYCNTGKAVCDSMTSVLAELEAMLTECALFKADNGATLTMSEVQALVSDIKRGCPTRAASFPSSPNQWGSGMTQWAGLGYGQQPRSTDSAGSWGDSTANWSTPPATQRTDPNCGYDVALVSTLGDRWVDIKRRFDSMRGKYPGVGGACIEVPSDLDTTGQTDSGGGSEQPPPVLPPVEEEWYKRTPFIILGLTVAGLAIYRFASTRKSAGA